MTTRKGLHARLTEIMHEVTGTNLGSDLDGKWFLSAKDRLYVRKMAAYLVKLMDEYDKLDPLP
jgi:hypothetical protein